MTACANSDISATAMILAAGMGRRMRPLTDDRPKPMIEVAGRSLINHVLDHLVAAGLERTVVNVHYMADALETHLTARSGPPEVLVSDERDALLETGGGVRRALPHFGEQPFLAINSDALWIDGDRSTLSLMVDYWRSDVMDVLLLMVPTARIQAYQGSGDFHMDEAGRLTRRQPDQTAPWLYGGVQILRPGLFDGIDEAAFSLNRIYDDAARRGRLFGLAHDGQWFHVGTPQAVADAEASFSAG